MPESLHLKLKTHLAMACGRKALNVPFSVFARLTNLNEFLLDVAEIKFPRTLAAKALSGLNPDATGLIKYVACVAVIDFLDQQIGTPLDDPTRERRFKDLKKMVDSGENEHAFR